MWPSAQGKGFVAPCGGVLSRHFAKTCHQVLHRQKAYENLQAILLFAFIKQRHAHQLLLAAIAIDLQDNDEDDSYTTELFTNHIRIK